MVELLNLLDRVTFTAQDFLTVCHIKEANSLARVGHLTADFSEENVKRMVRAKIECFCPRAEKITRPLVDRWRSLGFFIRACGVKSVEMMKNAIHAGVDGMTFDFPDVLLKELGRG